MSTARIVPACNPSPTPATSDRVQRSFALRSQTAAHDAFTPAAIEIDNGDEARYADKCGTYTKGIQQAAIGLVDLAAYQTFRDALDSGNSADFEAITLGGTRTLNGPQGGLAFDLECLDSSQFSVPPAPALTSEQYATELMELYWASLLRDVAFTDYSGKIVAQNAAKELSAMPAYTGPRNGANEVTPDLLFRGGFKGETVGPYLSQFLLQDTSMGVLPIAQKYTSNMAKMDYMLDPKTFLEVQNGVSTGLSLKPVMTPLYLRDGRGLAAYTHIDVLYQAYFMAYLVLNTINGGKPVPMNPGNPYNGDKTQNGFNTFGQPDIAATLAAVASEALKAVWYQKWFVHLRHRPESGGGIVYLSKTPGAGSVEGKLSPTVLNSQAVQTCFTTNGSYFLSQAFPEGSPTHPAYPTGHGTVAGACITVLKFFFNGGFVIPKPVVPLDDGSSTKPYTGGDAGMMTVNSELNKLAHNISFGHGIHAGIHWRSDTDTSIQLGEAVALSTLQDRADTYNEKFTVQLQKVDGSTAAISNQ
ncbi:MAG: vanadium-dependent haloperoxidase [Acidobacteriota bacterium]|nr:vanadium-dependent haloperoxidase [Acidobacteriota bacterium]